MPLMHCAKCHHEFEHIGDPKDAKCDWCDSDSTFVLEEKTGLERLDFCAVNEVIKVMNRK